MITRLPRITTAALVALAAGIGAGVAVRMAKAPGLTALAETAAAIGGTWGAALRWTVIPLIVCILITGLAGASGRLVGRLGAISLVVFLAILVAGEALSISTTPPLLRLLGVEHGVLRGLAPLKTPAAPAGDLLQALRSNELLNVMLAAILFAIAMRRISEPARKRLLELFAALLEVVLVVLGWLLYALPFAVFTLAYAMVVQTGFSATRALVSFVVIVVALLAALTLALYPAATLFGKCSLRRFAKAAAPVQAVAISTRSSVASLPALLEGGERLGVAEPVNAFVMPLSVAVFKANRPVSGLVKLFFLAHVCGIELAPLTVAAFAGTVLLLSFVTPGTPGAGMFTSTAPLLAVGIPIEAIVLVHAVDDIPDIFKTVTNVTANMTAAAIVARHADLPELEPEALETADAAAM